MKTNVRDTSIEAFYKLKNKESQSYRIFLYIEEYAPCSLGEVAKALKLEKSTVSARMNELANGKKKNGIWVKTPVIEPCPEKLTDMISGLRTVHYQVIQEKPIVQREMFVWSDL